MTPKVLAQDIAREHIGVREFPDGGPELADHLPGLALVGVSQEHIERRHAPLDLEMPDHHVVAVALHE